MNGVSLLTTFKIVFPIEAIFLIYKPFNGNETIPEMNHLEDIRTSSMPHSHNFISAYPSGVVWRCVGTFTVGGSGGGVPPPN